MKTITNVKEILIPQLLQNIAPGENTQHTISTDRGAILSAKNTHIGKGVVKGKEKGMVYVIHFALQ